ncbi:unnamed protein product [Nezara viridula]|uniref:Uncharacterized protein n=1 Tax=Nezara viridula TaxID=85310 RepID=A0A9P0HK73_NEZVI|nr:unnamed protein product [Nezara viridula]
MFTVRPYQQNIGKVKLMLNDIFKVSRVIGTFPIDSEYSGISRYNLAGGVFLYVIGSGAITVITHCMPNDDVALPSRILFIFEITPIIFFHSINLLWLVVNRGLMKELYDELMDLEYQLWKRGIDWSYNPSRCLKYLGPIAMAFFGIYWEIFYTKWKNIEFRIPQHIIYPPLISVTSQYLALLQVCHSLLKVIRTIEESGTVIKLTDKVLTALQKVNTLYEPQLLTYISNLFVVILVLAYSKINMSSPFSLGTVCWAIPIIIFHSINLLWLVVNRRLMKEIYEELTEIESQLCNRGILHEMEKRRISHSASHDLSSRVQYYKSVFGVTAALPFDIEVDKDN